MTDSNHTPEQQKATRIGFLFAFILLVRTFWMFWSFSYAFYPDSNLYVHLGGQILTNWYISPMVTFPYPLLNALTGSYFDPAPLIWVQIILSSLVGGFFVYVVARKDITFAWVTGVFLTLDLVWGSMTRTILTDGLFATLSLLTVGLLIFHFDRRQRISNLELLISGIIFALSLSIRPSHIFLIALLPPFYGWLTRSWKKVLSLSVGIAIFLSITGLINLRGSGEFYILSSKGGYTNDLLATPLFVYQLFSPDNGPASKDINQTLNACYPGVNFVEEVDRSNGGAFDSENNMSLIFRKIVPCIQAKYGESNIVTSAYVESLTANPVKFAFTMIKEMGVFLRYGNPYILTWMNNASNNYACTDMIWCQTLQEARYDWDGSSPAISLYEKIATKVFQAYLAPVAIIVYLSPEKETIPYVTAWLIAIIFALLFSRGRMRLLAILLAGFISYTALVVVAGLGFTERYAAMLSPLQSVFSAIVWILLFRLIVSGIRRLIERRRALATK